jgi:L-asparaginase II
VKLHDSLQVQVFRGGKLESSHRVHAVLVNAAGEMIEGFGDGDFLTRPVFPRSAIKPLQSLLLLRSGAWKKFSLSLSHLALACASHQGESMHLQLATQWLEQLQLDETAFACGAHWPVNVESMQTMVRKQSSPPKMANNCSGKHLGLLTSCLQLGFSPAGYQAWTHPIQMQLRKLLSEIFRVNLEAAPWGVDGCGIPTYAIPLGALAGGMAYLLGSTPEAGQVRQAMWDHPQLVGGTLDSTSLLLAQGRERFLLKHGAEGVTGGIDCKNQVAFFIKTEDGQDRATQAAVKYLLQKWGLLAEQPVPVLRNWAGDVVGEIRLLEA